ncbi:type I restriction-modification enzyme R subunit C-terminal domain-containing protein [Deinococcus sp. PESE-13]
MRHRPRRVAARLGQLAQAIGEKTTIAQVQQNANLLAQLQTPEFWQETNPTQLEKVRERLRTLSVLVEREIFDPIVVDFRDHLLMTETPPPPPAMNMAVYKAGVSGFVRTHIEQPEIQKIRNGQPLNLQELRRLEDFFFSVREAGSRETFEEAYGPDEHLGAFVRRIVGLERGVAQKAFEAYSAGKSLDRRQLQYIQFLIDAFDRGGVINPDALYNAPFTNLSDTGPEGVFGADTPPIWDIVERLSTTIKA